MRLTLNATYILILGLVVAMSVFAVYFKGYPAFGAVILGFSGLKFWLVVFQYMDMKKAHAFWKIFAVLFVLVFIAVISGLR